MNPNTRSRNRVTVETNWLLDVALQQDPGSRRLWDLANEGSLIITIPALCLAESVKALEAKGTAWRRLAADLGRVQADLRRSLPLTNAVEALGVAEAALVSLEGPAEARLWQMLREIDGLVRSRSVRLLQTSAAIVICGSEIRDLLKLSPADALVLAAVIEGRSRRQTNHFLSRDVDAFGTDSVRDYISQFDITYHPHSSVFLRTL